MSTLSLQSSRLHSLLFSISPSMSDEGSGLSREIGSGEGSRAEVFAPSYVTPASRSCTAVLYVALAGDEDDRGEN